MIARLSQGTVNTVTPADAAAEPWVTSQTMRSPRTVPITIPTKETKGPRGRRPPTPSDS